MTGEGLGCKPKVVEHAKFDYSPLGKVFNKGMAEDDQEEGPLKRVKKKIGDKNEALLKAINDQKTKESDKKDSKTDKTKNIWS